MNIAFPPHLEVLQMQPEGRAAQTPLLFVHGAYAGAWLWQEHFLGFFAQLGWPVYALSLSGHGRSAGRERLDLLSINDYVQDVMDVVACLPTPPVLIGHSMGGMVVQKYLEHDTAPAAILMASVPPGGLVPATLGLMMTRPRLIIELNRIMGGGMPHLETLREALFHGPVEHAHLQQIFMRCQPESMRAVWDMSVFNLPSPARMHRIPMQVLGAAEDRLIPVSEVEQTARVYGVTPQIFPAMGHAMMLEEQWEDVATCMADWLGAQGLQAG